MTGKNIFRLALIAAFGAAAWAADKYDPEQLKARFYYDLGPSEIDVSSYPKNQQAHYAVFKRTCSQCHTLARPINAPIVSRQDWKRFIERMHLRTKVRSGTSLNKEEAKTIVEFLAYDAARRKVAQKANFEAKGRELQALFSEVQKERGTISIEEDKKKARETPMYSGENPQP